MTLQTIFWILAFFVAYGALKTGVKEFFSDLAIALAHLVAFMIRTYKRIKRYFK